jgi:hypothetical protein
MGGYARALGLTPSEPTGASRNRLGPSSLDEFSAGLVLTAPWRLPAADVGRSAQGQRGGQRHVQAGGSNRVSYYEVGLFLRDVVPRSAGTSGRLMGKLLAPLVAG